MSLLPIIIQSLLLIFILIILLRVGMMLWINLQGPFYSPTKKRRLRAVIGLAALKPGQVVTDLGSGDGRVLIALMNKYPKTTAVGYEIDPILVRESRKNIKLAGLSDRISIRSQSFWKAKLDQYDVIIVYGITHIMKRLQTKLIQDLKSSQTVLSVFFTFPDLPIDVSQHEVHQYTF